MATDPPAVLEMLRLCFPALLQVGGDGAVVVHGNSGCGSVDIGNVTHIASPVDKLVTLLRLSHQVDHLTFVASDSTLSKGGYFPTFRAQYDEVVLSGRGNAACHACD